jgi:4-hydroxy-2-oxoglutarate aldolase
MLKESTMAPVTFEGIFPPIPTPFAADGAVAYDKLAANVERWGQTGIRGYVVLGSNGEYPYLSEEEKREAIRIVMQAAPADMPVIAGTGCESTAATIQLTEDCARFGVAAALVVTPHYYAGRMTPEALIRHYRSIADASPIPVLLYNVPKFTHINLDAAVIAELSGHPRIGGIKDSSGNVAQLGEYLNAAAADFAVLAGTASVLSSALALGCSGGILALANIAPEACVQIQHRALAGDMAEASRIQRRMLPVNKAVTATYGVAGLKAALDMLGYYGGPPRQPLLPSTPAEKEAIQAILTEASLL